MSTPPRNARSSKRAKDGEPTKARPASPRAAARPSAKAPATATRASAPSKPKAQTKAKAKAETPAKAKASAKAPSRPAASTKTEAKGRAAAKVAARGATKPLSATEGAGAPKRAATHAGGAATGPVTGEPRERAPRRAEPSVHERAEAPIAPVAAREAPVSPARGTADDPSPLEEGPAATAAPIPAPPVTDTDLARAQIRELEDQLDQLLERPRPGHDRPAPADDAPRRGAAPVPNESTVFDTARDLFSSDSYLRKWGRLAMRSRSEELDPFGFDPVYEQRVAPAVDFLYTRYFRVECAGKEHIPTRGRCLFVANHSGTLPIDGLMLRAALRREPPAALSLRWLVEDYIHHFPFVGAALTRLGAVRACPENAERLLALDAAVAVFPEGSKGVGKTFADRYRLQRFGRGGFVRLAIRTGTPIVPVAIVGAEEMNPALAQLGQLAKALGLPYFPVTPTFPALGPVGLLPAPTKWRILFGEPIVLSGPGGIDPDDDIAIAHGAERVRATIQGMLDGAIAARRSVFFG